jgi:hypothetical protein
MPAKSNPRIVSYSRFVAVKYSSSHRQRTHVVVYTNKRLDSHEDLAFDSWLDYLVLTAARAKLSTI